MLERAFQAAPDEPGVERVMAVLDEHGALRKAEESPARVLEFRRANEHRAIDVVAPPRVRVDRCAAVDESVEKRERPAELEALGADLEDQERRVARGLDIEGDKLGVVQPRVQPQLRRVDRDLLPPHRLRGAPGLEVKRTGNHLANANALLAKAISSDVIARRRSAAPAYTPAPTTIGMRSPAPSRLRSGKMTAPMTSPAIMVRQLRGRTGMRPMCRDVNIQPTTPSTISVSTVAQLAPMYPKNGIKTRFSDTLASRLQPAAQVNDS